MAFRASSSPSIASGPSGKLMSVNKMSTGSSCSKRAIASLAFAADKIMQPRASMMDSARARTVGSSSTTRTVVGLAFSDFIRPTPLAFERQPWGKSEVPTLAVILQFRFHLLHLCSKNSDAEAATDYKLAVRAYRGVSAVCTGPLITGTKLTCAARRDRHNA